MCNTAVSESEPTRAYVVDSLCLAYHEFSGVAARLQRTKYIGTLPGRWRFSFESLALVSVLFLLKGILAIILGLLPISNTRNVCWRSMDLKLLPNKPHLLVESMHDFT
uniref:Uncharacterized protein n=1 Tax=Mus spicilegus TaxID=10103 RepID=A0A8C6MPZ4_MUSSI